MNTIPSEIVDYIISFVYDRRGYNSIEYQSRVKDNESRMKRIRLELLYWNKCSIPYNDRISVSWLKPTQSQRMQSNKFKESLRKGIPQIFYHTGCYLSEANEKRATDEIEMSDY
jgi:hypothetical protein